MGSYVFKFFYNQFFVTPPLPTTGWTGQTVIVTGANTGLGLEAARHLAAHDVSTLIIAVRNVEKGNAAKQSIVASTRCDAARVQVWPLDLSSYDSVTDFAARVEKDLPRVDAVLLNAGINTRKFTVAEGDESTITVNVISTFLLAFLLLPHLKAVAKEYSIRPIVAITASEVHFFTSFPERSAQPSILATLSDPVKANMSDRYNVSKLLEVLMVREFAARHPASSYPVTLTCLNPGLCHSELAREMDGSLIVKVLMNILARSTAIGARTLVSGAEAGPETHGCYMSDGVVADVAPLVTSKEGETAQKRVWKEVCEKLEGIQKGVVAGV